MWDREFLPEEIEIGVAKSRSVGPGVGFEFVPFGFVPELDTKPFGNKIG